MSSIIQDWVAELGLRYQGVIVSAVRGCDTSSKHSPVKTLARYYRGAVLRPHCGNLSKSASFMEAPKSASEFMQTSKDAFDLIDAVPMHYVLHLVHAAQIVGLYHPDLETQSAWSWFYQYAVRRFHLQPESPVELSRRLEADEATFAKDQNRLT